MLGNRVHKVNKGPARISKIEWINMIKRWDMTNLVFNIVKLFTAPKNLFLIDKLYTL